MKKPDKCVVTIVGPDYPTTGSYTDYHSQEVVVEVELSWGEYGFTHESYIVSAHRNTYDEGATWNDTLTMQPGWRFYLHNVDLQELTQAQKALKEFYAYVEKLPVKPATVSEYLTCLFSWRKVETVKWTTYAKHTSSVHDKGESRPSRVIGEVNRALAKLEELPKKQTLTVFSTAGIVEGGKETWVEKQ